MRKKKVASGVLIIVLIVTCFSGCLEFDEAYVPPAVLTNGWCENKTAYDSGSQNFGLEKWVTVMYQVEGEHPGSLQIGTIKTLMLMDENELLEKVMESILEQAEQEGIHVDETSKIEGTRKIMKLHQTKYFTYNATIESTEEKKQSDGAKQTGDGLLRCVFKGVLDRFISLFHQWLGTSTTGKVRIIGEVWNCADSGVSVICIGITIVAYHGPLGLRWHWDTSTWKKIVGDPYGTFEDPHPSNEGKGLYGNGLIYNVICH